MLYKIKVSEVEIEFIRPQNGLVAFASCAVNACLRVGNIAVYTAPNSSLSYRCVFPTKRLTSGRQVPCFYPYTSEAEKILTIAIVNKYIELMDNFHHISQFIKEVEKMYQKKQKHRRFVLIENATLDSSKWKELTHAEMLTYIYIKKNFNGCNNEKIPLKYSELKGVMASATLSKALKGLRNKGWVEKTQHGGMFRYFCLYKLTGKYDVIK